MGWMFENMVSDCVWSAQRVALRVITVDTLVSTLTAINVIA